MAGILGPAPREGRGILDIDDPASPLYGQRHGGSFVTGLIDSLGSAITLPRRVYEGSVDLNTDKGTEEVLNMAGTAMTGGLGGVSMQAGEVALGAGPIRVFHGSPKHDIAVLQPSERGPLGPGVYMTPWDGLAARYAGDAGRVYEKEIDDSALFHGVKSRDSSVNPYQVWRDQAARLVEAADPEVKEAVAALATRMDPSDGYPFYARLVQMVGSHEKAQEIFKKAGFKGMSGMVDGHEIVLFDPVELAQ